MNIIIHIYLNSSVFSAIVSLILQIKIKRKDYSISRINILCTYYLSIQQQLNIFVQ